MVVGTVKSYNASKGFGFIEQEGKDVFLMHKDLGGLVVKTGDQVEYTVEETEKGQHAKNVKVQVEEGEERYKGTVKSFTYHKGFGFIECDAFPGQDIFFMKTALSAEARMGEIKAGSWCSFKVEKSEKGPHAVNVFLIGAAGKQARAMAEQGGWGYKGGKGGLDIQGLLGAVMALKGGGGKFGGKGKSYGGGGKGAYQPQFEKTKGSGKGKMGGGACKWCAMGQCWSH